MKQCEHCGSDFSPKMDRQRFCTRVCSDAFYADERRSAVKAFRGAQSYHEIALADADAPGGRFARTSPPRFTGAAQEPLRAPAWSHDPSPPEPPHDGTDEGLTFDGRQCR